MRCRYRRLPLVSMAALERANCCFLTTSAYSKSWLKPPESWVGRRISQRSDAFGFRREIEALMFMGYPLSQFDLADCLNRPVAANGGGHLHLSWDWPVDQWKQTGIFPTSNGWRASWAKPMHDVAYWMQSSWTYVSECRWIFRKKSS